MRGMLRLMVATITAGIGLSSATFAAAPAAPSYQGVERTIEAIRQAWSSPGAPAQPNRPGWDALFDALLEDLRSYAKAASDDDRLAALDHIYQISEALGSSRWQQAANLREETRQWLRPRLRLAWARRRLGEVVKALPPTGDPSIQANRERWVDFEKNDLGNALRDYDGAATCPSARPPCTASTSRSAPSASATRRGRGGRPTSSRRRCNDVFNRPNINVSADAPTVEPLFNTNLITTGPVYRKGYVSQVTAGPKTGFGLLASDDGIAFYNQPSLHDRDTDLGLPEPGRLQSPGAAGHKALSIQRNHLRLGRAHDHHGLEGLGPADLPDLPARDRRRHWLGTDGGRRLWPRDRRPGGHEPGKDQRESV